MLYLMPEFSIAVIVFFVIPNCSHLVVFFDVVEGTAVVLHYHSAVLFLQYLVGFVDVVFGGSIAKV